MMNIYKNRTAVPVTLIVFLYAYAIPYVYAEIRTFHIPRMCTPKQRVYDCSLQFPSHQANSCLIYNTDVCQRNEFLPWNMHSLFKPAKESNTEFTVNILPYAAYIDDIQEEHPVSAINILLSSFNKNISGYSIIVTEDIHSRNVCRIIDFRNSSYYTKIPFSFFYDCFHHLREHQWDNVKMSFRAYPLNIELNYLVFIPRVSDEISSSSCSWTPLVMIFDDSLSKSHVQLKFSNVPNDTSIVFFAVTLLDSDDEEVDFIKIPANIRNDMITSEFQPAKEGYYSISIVVILANHSCPVFKSDLFFVGTEKRDYSFEIFIVLVIIMILSIIILVYFSCQRYLKSAAPLFKPTLLLVYFHKRLHQDFLVMYAEFLENHYGMTVYTLYKDSGNPKMWLVDAYLKSNIIVYVISEGLCQMYDQKNASDKGDHHWVEQLPEAIALIENAKEGTKKFCKICFPYSGKQYMPKRIQHKGPFFMLLEDMDGFLCYIFNCSSKLSMLNKLCCIKPHMLLNSHSYKEDYKNLKEKLKSIIEHKVSNAPLNHDENKDNLQNMLINQLQSKDEKNEMSNTNDKKLYVSLNHDKDREHIQKECKTIDEKSSFNTPNYSLEKCQSKTTELPEQKKNSCHVKKGYIRHIASKMVNFEV